MAAAEEESGRLRERVATQTKKLNQAVTVGKFQRSAVVALCQKWVFTPPSFVSHCGVLPAPLIPRPPLAPATDRYGLSKDVIEAEKQQAEAFAADLAVCSRQQ